MRTARHLFTVVLGVMMFGCQTNYYYKLTDNFTHKEFYTVLPTPPAELPPSIALTDPETGATTVTTAYTVTPISPDEYEVHRPKYRKDAPADRAQ
jgi:hypothetical protein